MDEHFPPPPGAVHPPVKHKCMWFNSADAQHNICKHGVHEFYVGGNNPGWGYAREKDCPVCEKRRFAREERD